LSDYRGRRLVWHTGGWPGMVSRLTLVPDLGLGVVVLTNQEAGAAFNAITMHVLDAYMEAPATDWVAAYAAAVARGSDREAEDWRKHLAARDARSTPSLPLRGYAGTYRDPWYGDVVVAQGRRGLELRFSRTPQLVGDLEHWQHDTFIVRWRDRTLNADAFVGFALDPDGQVREVRMAAVSPLTDFSFDFHDLRLVPANYRRPPGLGPGGRPRPAEPARRTAPPPALGEHAVVVALEVEGIALGLLGRAAHVEVLLRAHEVGRQLGRGQLRADPL